jgi:hypothetical protein
LRGENILKQYECEEGCSKCCGPKSFIALTDTRVIAREQGPNRCICCCEGAHMDTAIYLRDIEVMKEHANKKVGLCSALLISCLSCTLPCFLMNLCCGARCGDRPKYIGVKGGFGTEVLTFKWPDAIEAANHISAMIQPFKNSK